ncbi:unnamed protein product [Sympodiomycopsis kandeliae]
MPQPLKNADGTVNFDGVKAHVQGLQNKYAATSEAYEQNTGHSMKDSGAQGEGQVGQRRGDSEHDSPAGYADRGEPVGASQHNVQSETGTEDKSASVQHDDHARV